MLFRGIKIVAGVFLGAGAASVVFFLAGFIANVVDPTPPELTGRKSAEVVAQRVASTSTGKWITTVVGLALGAFLGGALGARFAREKTIWVTSSIGVLLSLWGLLTFYVVFPQVLWVPVGMVVVGFVFSYCGGWVVGRWPRRSDA